MSVWHRGRVRGGANSWAKFHLHVKPGMAREEIEASLQMWQETSQVEAYQYSGCGLEGEIIFPLNTRRDFSMAPFVIRKALGLGFKVYCSLWDEGPKGKVSSETVEFWQELALAQSFFGS